MLCLAFFVHDAAVTGQVVELAFPDKAVAYVCQGGRSWDAYELAVDLDAWMRDPARPWDPGVGPVVRLVAVALGWRLLIRPGAWGSSVPSAGWLSVWGPPAPPLTSTLNPEDGADVSGYHALARIADAPLSRTGAPGTKARPSSAPRVTLHVKRAGWRRLTAAVMRASYPRRGHVLTPAGWQRVAVGELAWDGATELTRTVEITCEGDLNA